MKLPIKKLHPNAILPLYASEGAAGMDLYACIDEPCVLQAGEAAAIPTGVAIQLPENMEAQIRGRSGLAFKHAIFSYNGTIDSDYRGEIKALLINHSKVPFTISPNMRIAQMVINAAVVKCRPEWTEELGESERGDKGFGSTGMGKVLIPAEEVHLHKPITEETPEVTGAVQPGYVRYNTNMGEFPPSNEETKDALLGISLGRRK